jgi:hypothetical protein
LHKAILACALALTACGGTQKKDAAKASEIVRSAKPPFSFELPDGWVIELAPGHHLPLTQGEILFLYHPERMAMLVITAGTSSRYVSEIIEAERTKVAEQARAAEGVTVSEIAWEKEPGQAACYSVRKDALEVTACYTRLFPDSIDVLQIVTQSPIDHSEAVAKDRSLIMRRIWESSSFSAPPAAADPKK